MVKITLISYFFIFKGGKILLKKIKLNKYLKLICFVFVGLLTFTLSSLNVSAETRGFAARAFRVNGEIRWKLYNVKSGKTLNGVKFITPSDGVIAYCIEPSIDALLIEDGVYDLNKNPMNFGSITGLSEETLNELELISFFGYGYNGDFSDVAYMATQLEIWQTVQPSGVQYAGGDFSEVDIKRAEIRNNVNKARVLPSFSYEVKDVIIGQETSFIDTNNVLNQFKVSDCSNCTATIKGNTLIVKSNALGNSKITLTKIMENGTGTSILYTKGSYQKLMTFSHPADFISRLTLNTLGGTVEINKLDKESKTSTPQSVQSSLSGAIYGIYKEDGTKVGTLTTDRNGYAKSDYLTSLGKFYLLEEKQSVGYLLDDTKYYFNITKDNLNPVVKVYEQGIKRDVEISKFYSQSETGILTPEVNIQFGFYDINNNLVATIKTDNQGWGKTTLPYGDYTVKQLNSNPNTEKVKDFAVSIKDNNSTSLKYSIVNEELSAKLKVVKVDSDSNKVLVKDGIKFKIKNIDTNEYVCQSITYPTQENVCVFETTKGYFITPYVLKTGNYQIEELEEQTIDGYVWNKEPLKFSINDNSELIEDEDFGVMLEVKFGNKQVKAEVEIFKYGEKFIIEDNSIKYEEIKLDGVSFELYSNGNIYSQDGTLIYEDKTLIDTFKTVDGYYKLSNLYLGNYCLIESESILNHKVDSNPICFSLEYKDQYTDIVSLSLTLKNYLKKGTLEFTKTDLTTGKVIPNTLIEIYTKDDELIFSGKTNSNGKIEITNLPINSYYIIEKEAATGYLISNEKVYFEILEDGEIVKANMTNEKIEMPETFNTDLVSKIVIIITALLGIGLLIYEKNKNK